MRIAVGAFFLDSAPTGLGMYTRNIVPSLIKHADSGHQMTVYAPCWGPATKDLCNGAAVQAVPSAVSPKHASLSALARLVWSQSVLPSRLRSQDVFYSPTHHGVLRNTVRQVITIHDLLAMRFPSQYRLQHYYFAYVLPQLIKRASAVVVVSEATRKDVHRFYDVAADKVSVVHGAVDEHFGPVSDRDQVNIKARYGLKDYILVVGASFPHKNIVRALEAFDSLQSTRSNIELVIAGGRPEYIAVLREKVRDLNARAVKFIGYVPLQDLPALYAAAELLLYPSLYEGFGLPPLEAMACGCPVVISNTPSLSEICGDAGYYVEAEDVQSIADGLSAVLVDPNLAKRLRAAGLQRVQLYSWDKTAREVLRVLESVHQQE
jgi:glycosyltransferase involved in cell wall biosynthesis